jgi:hypothetical protein
MFLTEFSCLVSKSAKNWSNAELGLLASERKTRIPEKYHMNASIAFPNKDVDAFIVTYFSLINDVKRQQICNSISYWLHHLCSKI